MNAMSELELISQLKSDTQGIADCLLEIASNLSELCRVASENDVYVPLVVQANKFKKAHVRVRAGRIRKVHTISEEDLSNHHDTNQATANGSAGETNYQTQEDKVDEE